MCRFLKDVKVWRGVLTFGTPSRLFCTQNLKFNINLKKLMIMDGIFLLYVLVVLAGMMLSGMAEAGKEDESQMANLGKEAGV